MAIEKNVHPHLAFAARYGRSHFKTFNASSALWRAEDLVEETKALHEMHAAGEKSGGHFGYRFGTFEAVNYYAVGFVTCLEWHARSRLVDLFVYDPKLIRNEDVEKISKTTLVGTMAEQVTVPYLVGAACLVSNVREYIGVFSRVFKELGENVDLENELRSIKVDFDYHGVVEETNLKRVLEQLFEFRHNLVHEVGMNVLAHPNIRDLWTPQHAGLVGGAVIQCMKFVEKRITDKAPKEFPNKLDLEGRPEPELEKLKEGEVCT